MSDRVHRLTGADPRTGEERIAAVINKVMSGNKDEPARHWDDSPTTAAVKKRETAKRKARK